MDFNSYLRSEIRQIYKFIWSHFTNEIFKRFLLTDAYIVASVVNDLTTSQVAMYNQFFTVLIKYTYTNICLIQIFLFESNIHVEEIQKYMNKIPDHIDTYISIFV